MGFLPIHDLPHAAMATLTDPVPCLDLASPANSPFTGGLEVGLFETYMEEMPSLASPHSHPHFEIFVVEGKGIHINDFNEYPVDGPSLVLIGPGQIHGWLEYADLHGPAIIFERDYITTNLPLNASDIIQDLFYPSAGQMPVVPLKDYAKDTLSLSHRIREELTSAESWHREITHSMLAQLLFTSARLRAQAIGDGGHVSSTEARLLRGFLLAVEQHFLAHRTISAYTKMLDVSATTLNTVVRDLTGSTPATILRNRLVLEAKRLLANSTLTIQQVAYALGFSDASYFTKFFQKATGLTPTRFVENHHY